MHQEITCQNAIEYEYPPDGSKIPVVDAYDGCQINCAYCFQWNDPMWNQRILVKTNLPEVLAHTLDTEELPPALYVGSRGDPYMPLENEYQLTRRTLEVLREHDVLCYLSTKSDAAAFTRDLPLFESFEEKMIACIGQTNLAHLRATIDPGQLPNIRSVHELVKRGITTWVFITPVLPGITDVAAMINALPASVPIYLDKVRLSADDAPGARLLDYIQHTLPALFARYQAIAVTGTDPYYDELRALYEGEERIKFVFGDA